MSVQGSFWSPICLTAVRSKRPLTLALPKRIQKQQPAALCYPRTCAVIYVVVCWLVAILSEIFYYDSCYFAPVLAKKTEFLKFTTFVVVPPLPLLQCWSCGVQHALCKKHCFFRRAKSTPWKPSTLKKGERGNCNETNNF